MGRNYLKEKSVSSFKKTSILFLKISISSGLIVWVLVRQISFSELIDIVAELNTWLLLLAFSIHLFGILFSGLRWQKLLKSQGVHVKLLSLIDSIIIGSFFNLFMPTRIGGDLFRVNDLSRACKSMSRSAASVFVERLLGISVLFFFAICASLIRLTKSKEIPAIWIGLTIGILGIVAILFVLKSQFASRLILLLPLPKLRKKLITELQIFRENTMSLLSQREVLVWGLWYSFILQINVVIHFWIIGMAIGFNIPMLDYFFIIPVQLTILMLPSINGIGLREISSIVLFGFYGIVATEAATFAFIDLLMMLAFGIIGCFLFLFRSSKPQSFESLPSCKPESLNV
jgi:hypothetical protein